QLRAIRPLPGCDRGPARNARPSARQLHARGYRRRQLAHDRHRIRSQTRHASAPGRMVQALRGAADAATRAIAPSQKENAMVTSTDATAAELARAIRSRECSAYELVQGLLDRIERRNPALNAIVTLDGEGALERARAADAALARGQPCGPLHGVPFTLKDCFETQGLRTTAGHPPLA